MRSHLMEAALLFISMLFYKNALGHSRTGYTSRMCSPAPTILFLFIAVRHVFVPMSRNFRVASFAAVKIAFIALFWMAIAVQSLLLLKNVLRKDTLSESFPLAMDDSRYLPARWKPIVSFLRENLSPGETSYTLSDELSIYYFVGKACPVRLPLLDLVVKDEQYRERDHCGPRGSQCEVFFRGYEKCLFRNRWLLRMKSGRHSFLSTCARTTNNIWISTAS